MNVSYNIECPWGSAVFRLKVIVTFEYYQHKNKKDINCLDGAHGDAGGQSAALNKSICKKCPCPYYGASQLYK